MEKHIVFVEDDPHLQKVLIKWLAGYHIQGFDNAPEAFDYAIDRHEAGHTVNLFILDIMLRRFAGTPKWEPQIEDEMRNGMQLGQALRLEKPYMDTPIIFLSAKLDKATDRKTLGDKIEAICFPKPLPYQEVKRVVAEILGHPEKSYWHKLASFIGIE